MSDGAAFGIPGASLIITASVTGLFTCISAIMSLTGFWDVKSLTSPSFERFRREVRDYRKIAAPAVLSVIATFAIGVAATLLASALSIPGPGQFTIDNVNSLNAGMTVLAVSFIIYAVGLAWILRDPTDTESLATHPQLIAMAAGELGRVQADHEMRAVLAKNLVRWSALRGATALGVERSRWARRMKRARQRNRLRRAFGADRAGIDAPILTAVRSVTWNQATSATLLCPIRVGWVLISAVLIILGWTLVWVSGWDVQSATNGHFAWLIAISVLAFISSPVALWIRLAVAVRRHGNEVAHVKQAVEAIRAARERAFEIEERQRVSEIIRDQLAVQSRQLEELRITLERLKRDGSGDGRAGLVRSLKSRISGRSDKRSRSFHS